VYKDKRWTIALISKSGVICQCILSTILNQGQHKKSILIARQGFLQRLEILRYWSDWLILCLTRRSLHYITGA